MTKVEKNCLACGDIITVRLADHKRGWGNFCDKACAAAHKSGQRPRDVNARHAEHQKGIGWASDKLKEFSMKYGDGNAPPKAKSVKNQVGKVKIVPAYHSPAKCWRCGGTTNGPGLCPICSDFLECMDAVELGWDAHKVWSGS